jgi:prepilin-type N-terminal cleavage/methylation domain-containing protein
VTWEVPAARRPAADAGFSLIEMLIATTVLLLVTGGILALANPAGSAYAARSEATDLQQRLRVGVDVMRRELLMAGAGTYHGAGATPLVYVFAPILPHAVGTLVPGSPDRPDPATITIMYVPRTAAQTTTRTDLTSEAVDLKVNLRPGCPVGDLLCGFSQGMRVLIFDALGAYDVFTVTSGVGDSLRVQHRDARFTTAYPAGAYITEVVSRTFYFDASERRLYSYDGYRSALPILDNVVGLRFDYFGEPWPPALRSLAAGPAAPPTTYGPRPPPVGTDNVNDDWGAGENCAFLLSGAAQAGRLADWGTGGAAGALVPIAYTQLNDGPWCPGMTNASGAVLPNRFDADMLRVRRVRVTLRVQVGSETLRGTNPVGQALFVHPGTARQAEGWVPDQEVTFEITPRNLNVGR